MRRSKEEKQHTHTRIVEGAARQFRAEGINGVGIAELMGRVGLTHGGFYAHFKNKDALVAEVCTEGFAEMGEKLANAAQNAPTGAELAAMIDTYLASEHRDDPATGCVMPTLAADIARHSPEVRATFTQEYQKSLDNMVPLLPENEDQRDEAMVLLAGMVGTMLLARAVDDPDLSERMLRVNREFYKRTFARHQSIDDEHKGER